MIAFAIRALVMIAVSVAFTYAVVPDDRLP
jgi:hypothetical protein